MPTDKKGNVLRGERSQAVSQAKLIKEAFTQTLTEKQDKHILHSELHAQGLKIRNMTLPQFAKLAMTGEGS